MDSGGKVKLKLIPGYLEGELVVKLYFRYNLKIIELIRTLPGRRWNQEYRYWYIHSRQFDLTRLLGLLGRFADVDYTALEALDDGDFKAKAPDTIKLPADKIKLPYGYLEKLVRKRYSPNTITTYTTYMKAFVLEFRDRDLDSIRAEEINHYILKLVRNKHISSSQQNQRINSIKFYYEKVLGKKKQMYELERPRKSKKLPNILSGEEIIAILESITNIKHKAIISTLYSAGLRRSELINLRKQDIFYDRKIIFIRGSKGKKDRNTILSEYNSRLLRDYLGEVRPNYWLFEGVNRKQYSATSIAKILNRAAAKAGIEKRVTPHMLRHSFATHLHEQRIDIRFIQTLLGHSSSKTTEIYIHMSNDSLKKIRSPLDTLLNENMKNS